MKKLLLTFASLLLGVVALQAATPVAQMPKQICSGEWKAGHVQGLAVDTKREYIYFSFTTMLIKMDMQGNVVGSVTGLLLLLFRVARRTRDRGGLRKLLRSLR